MQSVLEVTRRARLRLGDLAKHRPGGMAVVVGAGYLFLALATLVVTRTSWLFSMDGDIQQGVIDGRTGWLNEAMVWITRLGNRAVIGILLVAMTLWVLRTGRCRRVLLVMVVAFLANPVLEAALKGLVGRPRPDLVRLVPGNGPSFPSGHVVATVGFYWVLAVVVWKSAPQWWARASAVAAAAAVSIGVGFSRVYLGVHWFSDVVAGFLVGIAFVVAVTWALRDHHLGRSQACEPRHIRLRSRYAQ